MKTIVNVTAWEPVINEKTGQRAIIAHVTPLLLSVEEARELLHTDTVRLTIEAEPPTPPTPKPADAKEEEQ